MALIFQDNFTGTNGTALSAHAPDTGTSWTMLWANDVEAGSGASLSSNACVPVGGLSDGCIYTADAAGYTADYEVTVTVTTPDTGDDPSYIMARIQDQENMYAYKFNGDTSSHLYKKVSGTWSLLGSSTTFVSAGQTVALRVVGTSIKAYVNGVERISVTDSAISAAGKAGLGFGGGAELQTTGDDQSSQTLDNFQVNTIVSETITPDKWLGQQPDWLEFPVRVVGY